MALVNNQFILASSLGFNRVFENSMKTAEVIYPNIATEVKLGELVGNYPWLGQFPQMREWVGDRVLNDMNAYSYSLTSKSYEATIEIATIDFKLDRIGLVKPKIMQMAEDSKKHYDYLVLDLFEANALCYDGKPFFSDIHGTLSNIGTKKLSVEALFNARAKMMKLVGDKGDILNITPDLLVIPPELEVTAKKILEADFDENGATNIAKGLLKKGYLVNRKLTDPNGWYLLDTSKQIKPFLLQITEEITFVAMDKVDDEGVFMRDRVRYGVKSMDTAGYGVWQYAFYSDGTLA